jgi:alanyl aminopeptidase
MCALSCRSPSRAPTSTHSTAPPQIAATPATAPTAREPVPLGRLPAGVRPTSQALALEIDPARERFGGTAEIALHLDEPRDQLWLHGRGLAVSSATITQASGATLAGRWEQVDPEGVVRLTLPSTVSGHVTLRVAFDAAYDAQLVGVYRVTTPRGPAVFSKLEAIYARRAFPSFDEPAFKIPFDVTLTVPAGDTVIGNMPIVEEVVQGARKRVRFATTPPLPTYLVAFAVGPFETRSTTVAPGPLRASPLPVGAVAMRGRGAATAFALAETPALLAEQERYFGVAFPYPKLDLIAVPDFQSGAMENAGAITFRDSALLVDDQVTSLDQRIRVINVLAHEIAHQWFGDLVTMPWWDDLWLNEGFATFFATRTLRVVRPDLEPELDAAYDANDVMSVDGLTSARRIRQPIQTTHDITNAFDGITYEKGAAVLAMLEQFIGDEPFRRGVHDYLTAHATRNATTDDLVRALSAAAGRDLAPLVSTFLDQPGVPVVAARLRCTGSRGHVELAQSRWRAVGARVPDDAIWKIPVCVRAGIGKRIEQACTLLTERAGILELPACPDWVLPNAHGAGYYRAALPADELVRLRDRGVPRLSVVERVVLAHDLVAAFHSAAVPGGDVLRALEPLARDSHGAVALIPLKLLEFADSFVVDGARRAALRTRIARMYGPAIAALGWKPSAAEKPWRRLFRADLLRFLALDIEHPAVLAEAARLGRRLLGLDRDHVRHPDAVAPDLAGIALAAAMRKGGADVFDALVAELGRAEDAQIRQRALAAIASTRDPALVARALDLALDPQLRKNERLVTLEPLLRSLDTRDLAWSWLETHFDRLAPLLPDRFGGRIPRSLTLCDSQRIQTVRAFFAPRIDKLTGGPRNLAQAVERAEQCIQLVAAQRDSIQRYVDALR